jgi:D-alanine-D-alanine ligase
MDRPTALRIEVCDQGRAGVRMSAVSDCAMLPVLLLYDLDRSWDQADIDQVEQETAEVASALRELGHTVKSQAVCDTDLAATLAAYDPAEWVVFNWCEGLPGVAHSDLLVARTLTELGFTFTGSTEATLALSWDKATVMRRLRDRGVSTPYSQVYEGCQPDGWDRFPAIVRPAREHYSLGISPEAVVLTHGELFGRINHVVDAFQEPALVEEFIDGRELHVSLLGNGTVHMLPPAEMDFSAFSDVRDRLCSYDSKYLPGSRHYEQIQLRLPAELSTEQYARLDRTARLAYDVLGCRDYARLDIRMRDGQLYVLDVNPNTDLSAATSTVLAAQLAGLSHGALFSHLIGLAGRRHPEFSQLLL